MIREGPIFNQASAVTPSDTVNLPRVSDALLVGGAGVVAAVFENDTVTLLTVTGPIVLPVRVKRVNAASTTATGLAALYTV
jgi:hypothetical protein